MTVPLALPGPLGGALMAFIVCFNIFTMQYFLAPYGVETLPLAIYNLIRIGTAPTSMLSPPCYSWQRCSCSSCWIVCPPCRKGPACE